MSFFSFSGVLSFKVVRNPMVEKPNKDGTPPTIEYQEEEILVSVFWLNLFFTLLVCEPATWRIYFSIAYNVICTKTGECIWQFFFLPHSRTLFMVQYCSSATACIRWTALSILLNSVILLSAFAYSVLHVCVLFSVSSFSMALSAGHLKPEEWSYLPKSLKSSSTG